VEVGFVTVPHVFVWSGLQSELSRDNFQKVWVIVSPPDYPARVGGAVDARWDARWLCCWPPLTVWHKTLTLDSSLVL
jgi:hypothetical protein